MKVVYDTRHYLETLKYLCGPIQFVASLSFTLPARGQSTVLQSSVLAVQCSRKCLG